MAIPQHTRFTELVGCRLPIQQATMGGVTTPHLAGAVAAAGALGMLSGTGVDAATLRRQHNDASTEAAGAPIGIGFLVPFLDPATIEAAAAIAPLVECFYGDPDPGLVERIHAISGALAAWQVGSTEEAKAAIDAGCDVVIVQGIEAGGHVRGTTPLAALLTAVKRIAPDHVPIVAAGGIGDGSAVARALANGADAVRIGTRFVATDESDAHDGYVERLAAAAADDTVVTEAFSMGWPGAPHRVLRSSVDADPARDPSRRSPLPPTRHTPAEAVEAAALYAGTSVGAVTAPRLPAKVVIERLIAEAEADAEEAATASACDR